VPPVAEGIPRFVFFSLLAFFVSSYFGNSYDFSFGSMFVGV